jgi:hypothetical protein
MYGASSIPKHIDLSNEDVDAIMFGAWRRWAVGPKRMLLTVAAVVALFGAIVALHSLLSRIAGPFSAPLDVILNGGSFIGALALAEFGVRRFGFPPCLFAELRDRGHDLCLRCGYDLSALPGDEITCPECGRPGHRRPVAEVGGDQPGP